MVRKRKSPIYIFMYFALLCYGCCLCGYNIVKPSYGFDIYDSKYDDIIKKASDLYLPDTDHLWWKAQLLAESNLNPKAQSPVGAQGIAQIMPKTYECCIKNKINIQGDATPFNVEVGIYGGAYYLSIVGNGWSKEGRTWYDWHRLRVAGYNSGNGYWYAAQKLAKMAMDYISIAAKLCKIPKVKCKEPLDYVKRIERYYWLLKFR